MSTIVTRAGKGTALTWTEMDSNFTNLNTDKIQAGDNVTLGTLTVTSINATTYVGIPLFNGTVDGLVNAGSNTGTEFLRDDGTWAVPAGTGTDLTYTAATRILASSTGTDATLPLVSSADAGLAPASGGGTTNYLRADGSWAAPPGGSATPAGANTEVQYNNAGAFGAEAAFTYNAGTNTLTVPNLSMSGDALITGFVSAGGLIGDYLSLNQPGSAPVRGWYTPSTTEMRGNIATTNILNMKYDASYSFVVGVGVVPTAWSNTILPAYAVEIGDRASVSQFSGGMDLGWNTKVDSAYAYVARSASGTPALLQATAGTIAMKVAASNPGAGSNITFTTIATARGNSDMDLSLDCGRLKFPATQNPSSDANTLDDYEEGTWTPATSSTDMTVASIISATYTKIGRLVFFQARVTVDNINTAKADIVITGLPFTVATATTYPPGMVNNTVSSAGIARSAAGATTISFTWVSNAFTISSGQDFVFSGTYSV